MCGRLPRSVPGRAIIGVIALYALLLQAFLGLAAPAAASDPARTVLCAEHAGDAPADDKAPARCHPCCTLAHVVALKAPIPVAAASPWTRPACVRLAWRPEAACLRTGPPPRAASARGPPAA